MLSLTFFRQSITHNTAFFNYLSFQWAAKLDTDGPPNSEFLEDKVLTDHMVWEQETEKRQPTSSLYEAQQCLLGALDSGNSLIPLLSPWTSTNRILFLQPVDFVIKKEWLANCEQFHVSVSQEGELHQQRVCALYTQESNISEVILFKSKIIPPSTIIILDHVEIETCS